MINTQQPPSAKRGQLQEAFEEDVSADAQDPGHARSSFPTLQVGPDPDQ